MSLDLSKLSDEELKSIASGDLKNLPEQTLRLISGATPPAKSVPPVGIAGAPAIDAEMSSEFKEKKEDLKKDYEKEKEEITTTSPFTLPGFLSSPVVTGAGLLAAGYAAGRYGPQVAEKAKGAYKSIKERFMASPVEAPVRIEPIGFESFADMTPATQAPNPLGQTNMTLEDIERLRAAQQKPPETPPAPGPIARTPLPTGAVNPAMFSSSPKAPVPSIPPAPGPTSGPNSPITKKVTDTVGDLLDKADAPKTGDAGPTVESFARDANGNIMWPEKMSPASRAGAEAFMKQYPNHAEALAQEGRFGILGAGAGDNNLYNAYGADLRRRLLAEVNQGQPVGPYGNYTGKVNPAIQALPPESSLGKELAEMRINQPKSANRGALGLSGAVMPDKMTMGPAASKALKAGGKAFLGVAIADAANAASKGDYVGAAKIAGPALDPTGMLEAAINPESTARSLTSVSPMMGILSQLFSTQADERAKKAYAEKVGGGRGLAPASAYQR